jgi:nucleoside-diphosphate-sugar epimerase
MTESTPYNPSSRKGELRVRLAAMLENEMKKGDIKVIIARAADLYGPWADRSNVPYLLVFDRMMKGKSAQWMADVHKTHSFSYTLDCSRGLWLLVSRDDAFGQTWHLPTFNPAPDGRTFISIVAKELGVKPEFTVLSKWMIRMIGLFDRTLFEIYEMLYQNEYEYYFDSTKFNEFFKYNPVNYFDGIHETVDFLRKRKG